MVGIVRRLIQHGDRRLLFRLQQGHVGLPQQVLDRNARRAPFADTRADVDAEPQVAEVDAGAPFIGEHQQAMQQLAVMERRRQHEQVRADTRARSGFARQRLQA